MNRKTPAVIISGGAEIITVSLLEELLSHEVPIILISLGKASILKNLDCILYYKEMSWPPTSIHNAIQELGNIVTEAGASFGNPWPAFATEDGSLRLLIEGRSTLQHLLTFSHASKLKLGGLDKAELFEHLYSSGLRDLCAPTRVAQEIRQIPDFINELGRDCIIKPSLKPFSMELDNMPSKIFVTDAYKSDKELMAALQSAWHISEQWLVQKRLRAPASGEAVYWAISNHATCVLSSCTAFEKWKQPKSGGSGCWVCMDPSVIELEQTGQQIIESIGYTGILELPFLPDKNAEWRLLELNPRPWLQVGLPYHSGMPMVSMTYDILTGQKPLPPPPPRSATWVNPERIIMAALSGEYGSRFSALKKALSVIRNADVRTVYDAPFPSVKKRWVTRMLKTGLRQLIRR